MAILGFKDNDGVDVGSKYVTKDYVMEVYPELISNMLTPECWTWGYNYYGQLGDNTTSSRSSPVTTVAGGTNWKQVSGGADHTAAVKTDGTLWTWGANAFGRLGDNTIASRLSPVTTVGGGTDWKQVSGGADHTAAVKTDGTLWTWGSNGTGMLGDNTTSSRSSPVTTAGGGTNWKQVSGGYYHTAAVKTDGTLWTWGANAFCQLGDYTTSNRSSPVTTAGAGTDWKQVSAGGYHTAAVKTDGTLWTWGYNLYSQLGDNTMTNRLSPVKTVGGGTNWKQVACGYRHTAAVKTDGTLWVWGYNNFGQLGDNTTSTRSSPVTTVGAGTNWKQVSAAGGYHTAAVKTDGTLWTWGRNNFGQLADNTTSNRSSPVTTVAGGTNWKQVACGYYFCVALSESEGW